MAHSTLLFAIISFAVVFVLVMLFLLSISWTVQMKQPLDLQAESPDIEWGVLRTYNTPEQAHLDRAMLEGCGVPVRLANEHTVGTDWMYGIAVGVDLRVPKDRVESAELLLRDARLGDASVDLDDADLLGTDPDLHCEHCGSSEVYRVRPGVGWAMASVVLIGLPLLRRKRYQCDGCGSRDAAVG